jgi:four helix bundle protein
VGYYKDLIVWQKAMILLEEVYKIQFPGNETYSLMSQIRRSAISIPSNIAEGNGRNSSKEYVRFLNIANGSLYEFQTQLEISLRLKYIDKNIFVELNNISKEIEAMLKSLTNKISVLST